MKVVINRCFGGFGLSLKGQKRLGELMGYNICFYKQTKYDFRNGENEYVRFDDINSKDLFITTVNRDLGEVVNKIPNDAYLFVSEVKRDNPLLIQVVDELKEDVNGMCSNLKIIDIPDDIEWEIEEYDGSEWVSEIHRTWS